jgi:pimeloyl-ACP methyl ester carboxylesterase
MTISSQTWTEETVNVGGAQIQLIKGGRGEPLLILHDEIGHHSWLSSHEALAQDYTLYIPSHPGYGKSPRQDWIMNMRDMSGWYLGAMDDLGLGEVNVMGLGIGGWLAAEMATMCSDRFKKMIIVDAPGIRPPSGEIYDMFLVVAREYITNSVLDPANTPEFQTICPDEATPEQAEAWEIAREESCRLSWRPYMHYPALPHLLRMVRNLPTRIIWGREDTIVPLSVGEVYRDSIRGSRLSIIDNCGHRPEVEKPDEFVRLVQGFLSGS